MTTYNIGNLIRAGGDAKTVKGNDSGYLTAIMYMTPYKTHALTYAQWLKLQLP